VIFFLNKFLLLLFRYQSDRKISTMALLGRTGGVDLNMGVGPLEIIAQHV
jgi:hypothetical protein